MIIELLKTNLKLQVITRKTELAYLKTFNNLRVRNFLEARVIFIHFL